MGPFQPEGQGHVLTLILGGLLLAILVVMYTCVQYGLRLYRAKGPNHLGLPVPKAPRADRTVIEEITPGLETPYGWRSRRSIKWFLDTNIEVE